MDSSTSFLVIERSGHVAGLAYAGPYRARAGYASTREVSIYLRPEDHGAGLGRRLYAHLLTLLEGASEVHTVVATSPCRIQRARPLHTSPGFERVGVLREVGRKCDRWIDTALYQRANRQPSWVGRR